MTHASLSPAKLFALSAVATLLAALTWGHSSGTQVEADTPVTWTVQVDPPGPSLGDAVHVTAYASGTGGIAGLPAYTLKLTSDGPDPVLELKSPPSVALNQLDVPATWDLTAVRAGQGTLQINVTYEKQICDPTCYFNFVSAASPEVPVSVRGGVGGMAEPPDLEALPLEEPGSAGPGAGMLAAIAAALAAGAVAVGAPVWYARHRRLR
jgi:hypothetical protein